MTPKTLTEHREAWNKSGPLYAITSDEEMQRVCDALGVEYVKPKSMAEEWARRCYSLMDTPSKTVVLKTVIGSSWGDIETENGPRWFQDWMFSWLTAFEAAVREDERQRFTRHVKFLRDMAPSTAQVQILDILQNRIDEGE